MAPTPLARVLLDINGNAPLPRDAGHGGHAKKCDVCRSEEEIRAEKDACRQSGYREGYEAAKLEFVQVEKNLADRFEADQAARLGKLAADASASIHAGLASVGSEISDTVARLLAGFFEDRVKLEAMDKIAGELRSVVAERPLARLAIRGPQQWLDSLKQALERAGAANCRFEAADEIDVQITVDQTRLETRLGEWLENLKALR